MKKLLVGLTLFASMSSFAAEQKSYNQLYTECFIKITEINTLFTNELSLDEISQFSEESQELVRELDSICRAYVGSLRMIKAPGLKPVSVNH